MLIQTYQYLILYILIEDQLTSHLVNKCKMILLTSSTHKTNFSTICYRYSSDGKDILIQDRREYIYGNTSLCESGCIYKSINYTSNTVNCECNFNFSSDKSLHLTSQKNPHQLITSSQCNVHLIPLNGLTYHPTLAFGHPL